MIAEIKLGIDSVKTTRDLVKALKGDTEKAEMDALLFDIREHLADLQECLLNAQQVTDNILDEKRKALRDLEDERNRNSQLERYSLIEPRPGVFLHVYQPAEDDESPRHNACPKCFSEKTISILQKPNPTEYNVACPRCKFTYDARTKEEVERVERDMSAMISKINNPYHEF